jgi:hypothetical protein
VCLTSGTVEQVSLATGDDTREQRQSVDPEVQILPAEQLERKRNQEECKGCIEEHNSSADNEEEKENNVVPDSSFHVENQTSLTLPPGDSHQTRCDAAPILNRTRENPVNNLTLFNLTMKDFEGCRITPDGMISVYDAIAKFVHCSIKDAKNKFLELRRLKDSEVAGSNLSLMAQCMYKGLSRVIGSKLFSSINNIHAGITKYQFPGQGQRLTPVCSLPLIVTIFSKLPVIKQKYGGAYLYFISASHFTKVGIASDVQTRLKALQTASPFLLRLINCVYIHEDAASIERRIHSQLRERGKHVRGEWFTISTAEVYALIRGLNLQ